MYYRTLHLDERNDALYVGGMDRVIKVDARNVSRTDCERDTMHMEATAVAECVGKGEQPINLGNFKLIYAANYKFLGLRFNHRSLIIIWKLIFQDLWVQHI